MSGVVGGKEGGGRREEGGVEGESVGGFVVGVRLGRKVGVGCRMERGGWRVAVGMEVAPETDVRCEVVGCTCSSMNEVAAW